MSFVVILDVAEIKGFAFPFRRGLVKFPEPAEDDACIAGNILRCLVEQRGARVMREDSGSAIWEIVFENTGAVLRARIDYEVRRAIAAGEPRASVRSVSALEKTTTDGKDYVEVAVMYSVRGRPAAVAADFPV